MIVDLFAGPGGWSVAARDLGCLEVGIEHDAAACATRAAAGLLTIRADVAAYPTAPFRGRITGLIASPPCPAFSAAGKREGADHIDELVAAIHRRDWAARPSPDPLVWLSLDVGRWLDDLRPDWVALEQVPAVLPLWQAFAHVLRAEGYSAWAGILNAADYGVPQTRRRAILMASRVRSVEPPPPTHDRDPAPSLFGQLERWVSMAEGLGAERMAELGERARVGFPRLDDTGESADGYRERDWRGVDEPSFAVTEKARSWSIARGWRLNTGRDWQPGGTRDDAQTIDMETEPSPTILQASGGQWHLNPGRTETQPNRRLYAETEPAPTIAFGHDAANWAWERPATTIAGDARCWPPGHKINQGDIDRLGAEEAAERYGDRAGTEALRLEPGDALALQSFPRDYPVQGSKTRQFEQIGNAVPPGLARAILAQLVA